MKHYVNKSFLAGVCVTILFLNVGINQAKTFIPFNHMKQIMHTPTVSTLQYFAVLQRPQGSLFLLNKKQH